MGTRVDVEPGLDRRRLGVLLLDLTLVCLFVIIRNIHIAVMCLYRPSTSVFEQNIETLSMIRCYAVVQPVDDVTKVAIFGDRRDPGRRGDLARGRRGVLHCVRCLEPVLRVRPFGSSIDF